MKHTMNSLLQKMQNRKFGLLLVVTVTLVTGLSWIIGGLASPGPVIPRPDGGGATAASAETVARPRDEAVVRQFEALAGKVGEDGLIRVIVGLHTESATIVGEERETVRYHATPESIEAAQSGLLGEISGYDQSAVRRFRYVPFLGLKVTPAGLEALRVSERVMSIQEDAALPPALARSVATANETHDTTSGLTGAGQTVVVLDTGVDKREPMLANRVVAEACFSTNDPARGVSSLCPGGVAATTGLNAALPCTIEGVGCEQGTNVAGVLAGRGNSFHGVAPEAGIIAMQVFSRVEDAGQCGGEGSCLAAFDSDLISALEHVYELRDRHAIAAVTMSLGGGRYGGACDESLAATRAAIELLRGVGIATIVAAGSGGYVDALSAPACISSAVSVGATTEAGGEGERVDTASNSARSLQLLAPGEVAPGTELAGVSARGRARSGGTSMAAAHVAGIFALARERRGNISVGAVVDLLKSTGEKIVDTRNGLAIPRIRIDQALDGLSQVGSAPAIPEGVVATTISATQIDLVWNDVADETGYEIWRKGSISGTSVKIADVGPNMTSFQNTGLIPGRTYFYKVQAINLNGASGYSDEVRATTQPVPLAASNLVATVISATQIDLSWNDNSTNEQGYSVRRSTTAGGPYTEVARIAANSTTYTNANLVSGTSYYFVVVATNGGAESLPSNEASGSTPEIVPAAPSGLTVAIDSIANTGQLNLTWVDNSNNETGFRIERRTANGDFASVGTVAANTTEFNNTGLAKNTQYFYRVFAINLVGDSPASNVANATTPDTPPLAPTGLVVTPVSISSLDLSWTDSSDNETGFKVRRSLTSGGPYTEVGTVAARASTGGTVTFEDTNLVDTTTYYYKIAAINSGGETLSGEASGTTLPLPDPVSNLVVTALTTGTERSSKLDLSWTDNSGIETGFRVKRSTTAGGPYTVVRTLAANTTSTEDTGLNPQTTYYYVIVAFNENGDAEASNEGSAATPPLPAAPTNVVATANSSAQITVTWSENIPDDTGFEVYRKSGTGSFALLTTTTANATSYVDTDRISGKQTYVYQVVTVNPNGRSVPAESAPVTTPAGAPASPSSLTATPASGTSIRLNWVDNSETETEFRIERKTGADWSSPQVFTVPANTTSYVDSGLTSSTTYIYRVLAFAAAQNGDPAFTSSPSNEASATPPPTPDPPTGLLTNPVTGTRIDLTWTDASNNEEGFRIQRRSGTEPFAQIGTVTANVSTYSDATVSDGTSYTYSVTAFNVAGDSVGVEQTAITPLPAPGAVTAAPVSASAIRINWTDNSTNESRFRVERRPTGGGSFTVIAPSLPGNTTTYQDSTGLVVETDYDYRVFAENAVAVSSESNIAVGRLLSRPASPTGLNVTSGSPTTAQLTWTDASSNESNFRIRRKTGSGGTYATVGTVGANVTTFNDSGLSEGTEYFYQVTAFNVSGDSDSVTEDSVTTRVNAPSNLTVAIVTESSLRLNWTDNSGRETAYSVRRRSGAGSYSEIVQLPANATTFLDAGLTPDTTYTYRVFAINVAGLSAPSEEVGETPPSIPAAAGGLTVVANATNKITVGWTDNSANEIGFRIQRSGDAAGPWTTVTTRPPNSVNWEDTTVVENTTYFYQVVAFNAGGEAAPTAAVSATTPLGPPLAPSNLVATTRSNTQITLTWVDNATNEASYRIERRSGAGTFTEIVSRPANSKSYDDTTGLAAGIAYTYRVTAVNTAAVASSEEATTTTGATPPTPTALVASAVNSSEIVLTWNDSGLAELGFRIRRRIGQLGEESVVGTAPATNLSGTSYTDTGLKSGTTYYYTVTAFDGVGESLPSTSAFAKTIETFPLQPSGVTATAVSSSQIDVRWVDNSDNETSFKVQRKTGTTPYADASIELGPNVTSFTDTNNILPQTTYTYRVVVSNAVGSEFSTNEATVTTPVAPPAAPASLTATIVSAFQLNLGWQDLASNETGYRVYRKVGANGEFTLYQTLAANAVSFQDFGLEEGQTYAYEVAAYNSAGESTKVTVTKTMPILPAPPTGLTATIVNATKLRLTWVDAAMTEDGFRIFRSVGDGSNYTLLTTVAADTITYDDAGLTQNTEYFYRIIAFNEGGESDGDSRDSERTPIVPPAPTIVSATPVSFNQIDLVWTYPTPGANGHNGFRIFRSQVSGGPYNLIQSVTNSGTTSYSDTSNLISDRAYYYRIVATTPWDESPQSNEMTATTGDGPPDTPTNLTASVTGQSEITLRWTDNSNNETAFEIERATDSIFTSPVTFTSPANQNIYVDSTGLNTTDTFYYRVRAFNSRPINIMDRYSLFTPTVSAQIPSSIPVDPTGLVVGSKTATSITVNWMDNSNNESEFLLTWEEIVSGTPTVITLPANTATYTLTGLTEGTDYVFKLQARNVAGPSTELTLAASTLPLAPSALTATVSSFTSVTLNWTDNSSKEGTFQVERSENGGPFTAVTTFLASNETSYTDTGLTSGTTYRYRVYAVRVSDSSAFSNVVEVTPPAQPNAPLSLVATTNATTPVSRIDLTWRDNSNNETGFRIERRIGATGTWLVVTTVAAGTQSYQDTGLISGTAYTYRVAAVNAGGLSLWSNESSAATEGYPPNAPTDLVATAVSGSQINLSWRDNSDNESGFRIQRRQVSSGTAPGTWLTIATLSSNVTAFQNLNLIPGRTYAYRVIAFNNDGDATSNEASTSTPQTVPAAPTELTATAVSGFQINLTWIDNSGTEDGFRISRKASLSGTFTELATVLSDIRSYQDTGLNANTTYYYQVTAFNQQGSSSPSNEASARTLLPPPAPTNLVATAASSTQVNLSWSDNSTNETGFRIQRKTGTAGIWSEVGTVGANVRTFQNTGLTPGLTYIYRVVAYNAVTDSAPTNEASVTTPVGVPSPPTNLQAVAVSFSQINLTWVDNSGNETGFLIRRKIGVGGTYADLTQVAANITTFQDTGLASSVTYYYTVTALSSNGNSAASNEAFATTTAGGSQVPAAPSNLVATSVSSTQINLTWSDNSGNETGFKIRRKTGLDGTWADVATVGLDATSYADTSLAAGLTYYYTVRATNAVGDSGSSNEANATTSSGATTPLAPPGNLQVTATSISTTQITWLDTSAAETGFRIQRKTGTGSWSIVATVGANATSYQDSGLLTNSTYTYRVTAFNTGAESDPSNEHTVVMPIYNFEALSNGQPTSNSVGRNQSKYYRIYVPTGATELLVTTTGSNNVHLYVRYERQPAVTSNCRSEGTTSTEQCRLLTPGAGDWHIQVFGAASSTSTFSVTATYQGGGTVTAPTAPTNLAATTVSSSQINLTWTDTSSSETNFRIRRRLGTSTTWTLVATVGADVIAYQDTGLTPGETYSYYVTAFNIAGESANSNEVSATTLNATVTAPPAPTNLAATAASTTQINLSWTDTSSNETGFRIKRRASGSTTTTEIATVGANITTYQDSSLTAGTTYFYTVYAYNSGGNSADSNEAGATTQSANPTAPAAPGGLVATAVSAVQINLTWTDNSTNETGFRIRRKIGTSGAYADLTTVGANVTTYSDLGLIPGVTYFYTVLAFNANGNSVDSNEASALTGSPAPTAPTAPGGLAAAVVSASQINLSWTDNSTNETGFRIRRKTGSGGTYADLGSVGQNVGTYQDTGLTAGTTYFYQVVAFNGAGDSTASNEAVGTTLSGGGSTLPTVPADLRVTALTTNSVDLSWSDGTNETGYRIQRKQGTTGTYAVVATLGANVTSWQDTGLISNSNYTYQIASFNSLGESNYSDPVSVTVPLFTFTPIASGDTVSGTVGRNQTANYRLSIPAGASELNVTATGTTNIILYVRYDKQPVASQNAYNCLSQSSTATQTCRLTTPLAGDWHIQILGNSSTTSNFTMTASVTLLAGETAPTAPSNLIATPVSTSQINLSWTDGSSNETGFRIRRKTGSSGTYTVIAAPGQNVTSYQDTGLTAGTSYFYQVVAYNSIGDSAFSNETSATTQAAAPTIPVAPTGLVATAISSAQISLSWTDNATNETGFRIRRKTGVSGTYADVTTVGSNVTSYQDTGLAAGTGYVYQVFATNDAGNSGGSNEASATTLAGTPTVPAAPSGLAGTVISSSQVNLTWTDNSANESGFRIRRKTGVAGTYVEIGTVGANITSYQDNGLVASTTYLYQVVAYNSVGNSSGSNEVTVTTSASGGGGVGVPTAPSGLSLTSLTTLTAGVSWSDNSTNETGFRVERRLGTSAWNVVATLGANVTSYQDSGLLSNSTYFYRVQAFNASGNSAFSEEKSIIAPIASFTILTSGVPVSGSVSRNASRYYLIRVPEGTGSLKVDTTGTFDPNLYVRIERQPTQVAYNCQSVKSGAVESCLISSPLPGDWHIQVLGNSITTSNFTVTATLTEAEVPRIGQ